MAYIDIKRRVVSYPRRAVHNPLSMVLYRLGSRLAAVTALLSSRVGAVRFIQIILAALMLGAASTAMAGAYSCGPAADGGDFQVLDGTNLPAGLTLADFQNLSSLSFVGDCTIRNFPQDNGIGGFGVGSTLLNFNLPGKSAVIVMDNVYYTGNMACSNLPPGVVIWWVNGAWNSINSKCQAFIPPLDGMRKYNPGQPATTGETLQSIGIPFTYTLTMPEMVTLNSDGTYTWTGLPDSSDIANLDITDDLTSAATGAELTYQSNTAYLVSASGTTSIGSLTNLGDSKHLHFQYNNTVPAGTQLVIEITVVLDDTAVNAPGTQFVNTANWFLTKLVLNQDGSTTQVTDVPGMDGVSVPMTIAEPDLVLSKTGSATTVNLGTPIDYTLDVQNIGATSAYNAKIDDYLPAGMCTYDATSALSVQRYAADGTTPVGSALTLNTDYTVGWNGGSSAACQLTVTLTNTAAASIGPSQHLKIFYQSALDSTGVTQGSTYTNVAGATQWYNGDSTQPTRKAYNNTLTAASTGTPGVLDYQDAYSVTAALAGYYFQKSVQNLTTGASSYSDTSLLTVYPGDTLRYTLLLQNFTWPVLSNIDITDDLGALNAAGSIVPGSLSINTAGTTIPPANYTFDPNGGTNGAGSIHISGLTLGSNAQYQIQFDVKVGAGFTPNSSTTLYNQAYLNDSTDPSSTHWSGPSDDPYIGGTVLLGDGGEDQTPVVVRVPDALLKANPSPSTATIGEQFTYRITVPQTPFNAPLYDVNIIDTLPSNVSFVNATVVSGGTWSLSPTVSGSTLVIKDNATGIDIPAGGQAVIDVTVALQNTSTNTNGTTFTNTASYTYNKINGDSSSSVNGNGMTTSNMTVIEPDLTATKTVTNVASPGNPADIGDTLEYTVTITNSGTSEAFDTSVVDALPGNLAFDPSFTPTAKINGVGVTGFVPTPSTLASGAIAWGEQNGDGSLDIPANPSQPLVLTYRVTVMAVDGTAITNSVYVDWTSLNSPNSGERTGAGCPTTTAPNDYCVGPATASINTADPTNITKTVLSDTWDSGGSTSNDSMLRVGDTVDYRVTLTLREGLTQNVKITDTLPTGLAFEGVLSINGVTAAPYTQSGVFSYTAIPASNVPSQGQTGSVTWTLGDITNLVDYNPSNDTFVIEYRARVQNNDVLSQTPTTQGLGNSARVEYAIGGVAAAPITTSASISVQQPQLTVSKAASLAGGDTLVDAGETVTYTVNIINSGDAPAYDAVLQDTLPLGLRQNGVTTTSISLVDTSTNTTIATLSTFAPNYDPATGVATWNFDTGAANAYTIPAGNTLRVTYTVQADVGIGAGLTLTNAVVVPTYYSFDNNDVPSGNASYREVYGPTNTATSTLTSTQPGVLQKSTTQANVTIGEQFKYRITVPAIPSTNALYDVRITDDLTASAADMSFVSVIKVSGSQPWSPVNTGDAKHLVIQDTTNGIDIPAGQQVTIEVTLVLDNTAKNVSGLVFTNTAGYTYDSVNNNAASQTAGLSGTSGNMTIIGPDTLVMSKNGPTTMRLGLPGTFILNLQNTGSGTAWDATVVDKLPNPTPGGMCDSAPANISARIYQSDGTTPVSPVLTQGTDYVVSFAGTPTCTLTLTMQTASAAIGPGQRLIISYDALLDVDNVGTLTLTNIAAATQWFGGDTAGSGATGSIHTYTGTLTDGTVGTNDEQDAFTLTTEAPVLLFQKSVTNVTSGQNPGSNANPGDTLRYTLHVENVSPVTVPDFFIVDELDALNSSALFVPGSLQIVSTLPSGADSSNTDANGGTKGTGLLDIRHLSLDAQGGARPTLDISFEVRLIPVIDSGTVVLNQAHMSSYGFAIGDSDDPNVNGADDPSVSGDEDPTQTVIISAPVFDVFKSSADLTGDPAVLAAGDTLRYTVTVKNIGNENATDVKLNDIIPAYTTYVANSSTLNGNAVTDPSAGVSPLQNGMLINAPEDPTPGAMRADASGTASNVATVTFDVVVNSGTVGGTVISNQAQVNGNGAGTSGVVAETPSDDPSTTTVDDPTLDVVGNLPLVDVLKTVQLQTDSNGNGYVDPDDVLRYTMTVNNLGAIQATGVTLVDAVPANTTFVSGSVTLNSTVVPDSGISPLIAGMAVNSAGAGAGVIAAGQSATVTFDVAVNGGTAAGTVISNQGTVSSIELADEPTDADGIDTNGDQPTTIVVGNVQLLSITKEAFDLNGGNALAGDELEYVVRVQNTGVVPATNVVITDTLAPQLHYTANSATLNGSANGTSYTAPVVMANYSSTYGTLAPGATAVLRFRATIDSSLTIGTTVSNTAVVNWNVGTQNDSATVSFQVGAPPTGAGSIIGTAWHDANDDQIQNTGEPSLVGWIAELYRNNNLIGSVTTDANGQYQFSGLAPNATTTDEYSIHFVAPGAGSNTALLGLADSPYTNDLQAINQIKVSSGSVAQGLNMPIMPDGVVYDSVSRAPVAGATVAMLDAANQQPLPSSCFDDASQQNQVTAADGFYRFDINFTDPACPAGGDYLIRVTPPATGYEQQTASQIIPPLSDVGAAAFSVPGCLGSTDDAIPATTDICEVVAQDTAPTTSVAARTPGTNYYLNLTLDKNLVPGESQLFNNHIPLDPVLGDVVAITKTAAKVNVSRGDMVPYTITVNNGYFVALQDLSIVDTFPPGFKYVKGSSRFDGQPLEPVSVGNQLRWENIDLATDTQHTIKLVFIVGSGVSEGEYVNRAQVINSFTSGAVSGEATATVRVVPDPTFDCTDVIGKVFDDRNLNGAQDEGEKGLPGVRLVNARGLIITSDEYGRFHITCAVVPNESRGSNYILKLDDRSLPSGYRITTENPRVQRATRGKMMKFNFGATIHHVVRLDVADGVFEPDSTTMRQQWLPRIALLLEQLRKSPSVLRLSYLADVEDKGLVRERMDALKERIAEQWAALNCCYKLTIESEVYWRRGAPPDRSGALD